MEEIAKVGPGTVFKMKCVAKTNCLAHFGIRDMTSSLYGYKPKDILEVDMVISEDQTLPENDNDRTEPDYWGWYDNDDKRISMMYSARFLLDMCFPYGIKASEKAGQGKAFRFEYRPK